MTPLLMSCQITMPLSKDTTEGSLPVGWMFMSGHHARNRLRGQDWMAGRDQSEKISAVKTYRSVLGSFQALGGSPAFWEQSSPIKVSRSQPVSVAT